jgi:hypothetical protein
VISHEAIERLQRQRDRVAAWRDKVRGKLPAARAKLGEAGRQPIRKLEQALRTVGDALEVLDQLIPAHRGTLH